MSDKKYISIPTIDNVNLPQSLINKCRAVYNRYGKYKLYDIINADLNDHAKYTTEERESFKKLELTKRYLYLYRKAMAETLSYAYNTDQTDLLDSEVKEFDDTNTCPYCGHKLTLLSQIGKLKGFPKSHYRDVWKEYNPIVLFSRYPVKSQITISLGDYLNTITPSTQLGYSFSYWSLETGDNRKDITTIRVTKQHPDDVISTDAYAAMSDDEKELVVSKADISIFHYIDDTAKNITIYAMYRSNTDASYISRTYTLTPTVKEIFDIYSSELYDEDGEYKSAFSWLKEKDSRYEFSYFALDADTSTNYVPGNDDVSEKYIADYDNKNEEMDVVTVFTAKEFDDANYLEYGKTIRQLAIEVLKEPILVDTVSDTDGNVTEVGKYTFFQWSLDDEASVYILDDDRSLELVQNLESIINDDTFTIYALFKYNLSAGLKAYDDDCYCSTYRLYTGIDRAYSNELVTEYVTNYDYYQTNEDGTLVGISTNEYKNLDDTTKATCTAIPSAQQRLTAKQWSLLSENVQSLYTGQESHVIYKGYIQNAGSAGALTYDKNYKLHVITCSQNYQSNGKPLISYQDLSYYDEEAGKPTSGVELTGTTPGDFEILYYLPKDLWYTYNEDSKLDVTKFSFVWIKNDDPTDLRYNLDKYIYYTTDTSMIEYITAEEYEALAVEEYQSKYTLISEDYTKYIYAKYITKNEYLGLSTINKQRCNIRRIYYTYSWSRDIATEATDTTVATYNDIYELQNVKTVEEYNQQTGILDGSYGIDTSAYADITNETYRLYRYYINLDENVQAALADVSDILNSVDDEIGMITDIDANCVYDGNNWLLPITSDNIEDIKAILDSTVSISGNDSFVKSGIYYIPKYDYDLYVSDGLDLTRIKPTDNTGTDQLNYEIANIWKCATYANGTVLLYRPHRTGIGSGGKNEIKGLYAFPAKIAAYKYNTSISMNIDCILDDDGTYKVQYSNIQMIGPSVTTHEYYDSTELTANLPETLVQVKYVSYAEEEEIPTTKELVRRTCTDKSDTQHYGTSEYNLTASVDANFVRHAGGTYYWAYSGRWIRDNVDGTTTVLADVGFNEYYTTDDSLTKYITRDEYSVLDSDVKAKYKYIPDDFTIDEKWVVYSALPRDTNGDVEKWAIYRYETDEEFNARVTAAQNAVKTFNLEMYGSDSVSANTSGYVKWYSTSNAKFIRLDGTEVAGTLSGGYPDDDGNFVTITETYASNKISIKKASAIYSGDVAAVIDSGTTEEEQTEADTTKELDSNIWWNRYSNELKDVKVKNDWITNVGINFIGWVWLGWDNPVKLNAADGKYYLFGVKGDERTPSNDGLIEAYVFDDTANYVSQGFQRVLYPTKYNSSYYTNIDPVSQSAVIVNNEEKEPIKLLRYCNNPECELVKARNNKKKWSYQNNGAVIYQTTEPTAMNQFTLDEYEMSLPDQTDKAEDPNSSAVFGLTGSSSLNSMTVLAAESYSGESYDIQGFNLDVYPWHYRTDDSGNALDTKLRYMLHRGGFAEPDIFRFEFEYKYATNEYSQTKYLTDKSDTAYSGAAYINGKTEHLKNIKETSHVLTGSGDNQRYVIPMTDRPITYYQNRYKEVLFNTFENTFNRMIHYTSPFVNFSEEEITILNSIVKDLFTYDSDNPTSTEYLDFKHKIISLMTDLTEYEFYKEKYWDEDKADTYTLNKQIVTNNYLTSDQINDDGTVNLTDLQFKDLITNTVKYYTIDATEDNWNKYIGRNIYRMIIRRHYTASSTTSVGAIVESFGTNATYSGATFTGYARDSMASSFWHLDTNEANTTVRIGESIDIYLVYDFTSTTITEALGSYLFENESGNQVYIKINIEDELGKIWYNGEEYTRNSIETTLAELHEKIALPSEFMCCLFCFIISPKRYNIVVDENGVIGSLFVPTGVSSTIKNEKGLSITRDVDEIAKKYSGAIITKPWNNLYDEDTGRSTKEQYLILYSTGTFDAYSFFNDGWLKDVYGEIPAAAKFPLYNYGSEERMKANVIEVQHSGSAVLLKIIPFSNEKYQSAIALIYNFGIEFVDLGNAKWISNASNIISSTALFDDETSTIVDVKLDTFNDGQKLILVSNDYKIATYDLYTETMYDCNYNNSTEDVNVASYNQFNTKVCSTYASATLVSKKSASVRNITAAVTSSDSDSDTYLEPRVGLLTTLTYLEPIEYDGKPWVLNSDQTATLALPAEISDEYYNRLTEEQQEKYHIHPKLTVRYAWGVQGIDSITVPETMDYTYEDLYTGVLTKTSEGDFKIYRNGEVITKDEYFNYTDEEKAECKIYSLTTINYTFVRLSLSKYGTGIYDDELNARLSSKTPVYALYYKIGVEVDEKYGYKIRFTENIVDGSDTIVTDEFNEYLNDNTTDEKSFGTISKIDSWLTNNPYTDYSSNYTESIPILSTFNRIFPVNGYYDTSVGKYIPYYILSDGYKIQLIYFDSGAVYTLVQLDYEDENELLDVVSIPNEMKIYLVFKNQRVVVLQTSEYVPVEDRISLNHDISLIAQQDTGVDRGVFTYMTDDNKIFNLYPRFDSVDTSGLYFKIKESTDYARFNGEKIVALINTSIIQMDEFKHIPNFNRWIVYDGNNHDNLGLAQIN